MPNFQGSSKVIVQPNDLIAYSFKFTTCSSATANDGSLPFGTTIASVDVEAFSEDGTDVTSLLIVGIPSLSVDVVTVELTWPGTTGRYKLTFIIELSNGQIKEFDFDRVFATDE